MLFPYFAKSFIFPSMYYNTKIVSRKNDTNNDCALIPKKNIPKNPLIWKPSTYY